MAIALGVGGGLACVQVGRCAAGNATLLLVYPPPGYDSCWLTDVTPDGRVFVGTASIGQSHSRPFWWDRVSGFQVTLDWPPPDETPPSFTASRVSADGSTIVGEGSSVFDEFAAMRWRRAVGEPELVRLGRWPYQTFARAKAVSDDGLRVGTHTFGDFFGTVNGTAVVWPSPLQLDLPQRVEIMDGFGAGDGFHVVGTYGQYNSNAINPTRAFVRDVGTGVTELLGPPPPQPTDGWSSIALAASPSGAQILGGAVTNQYNEYVRWRRADGAMTFLDCPDWAQWCLPLGVSDWSDLASRGPIVVGWTQNRTASFWWPDGHAEDLWGFLNLRGAGVGPDVRLMEATGVSADGRVIAGYASLPGMPAGHYVGFVATLGTSCPADVDDGRGLGIPDNAVLIDDLLLALDWFEEGDPRIDVDDGTGAGARDGAVTVDDLLYFLARFEAGC